jgi:MFS family permease
MKRAIPFFVFLLYLIHGASVGMTDDEAYYWVLAQTPDWGYAYHPPAVAWLIALTQILFASLPRLSCALIAALIFKLAIDWAGWRVALVLASFVGFFTGAWMIVPDIPLLLGWMLMFLSAWRISFEKSGHKEFVFLAAGAALALLSKYSAVLAIGSAGLSVLIWASRENKKKGLISLVIGTIVALIPILIWNAKHEWASILYQVSERHGGGHLSWLRFFRFWLVETLLAGPALMVFFLMSLGRAQSGPFKQVSRFVLLWSAPAALVFCLQPLWSDFKLHWAFVVWFPLALELGYFWSRGEARRLARVQTMMGIALGGLVLISCHLPVTSALIQAAIGKSPDPRWDVTNDMYGWGDLGEFMQTKLSAEDLRLPVVGGRYQTAAQAAFALRKSHAGRVTMLPRGIKERDEWPNIDESGPFLFVSDNRYTAAPEYAGHTCEPLASQETYRLGGFLAKKIDLWKCSVRPVN